MIKYLSKDGLSYFCGKIKTAISGKADDSAVVHITGNESVAGDKTFNDVVYFNRGKDNVDGTSTAQLQGMMASNDYWQIRSGATASDSGFLEIITGDNGNEPIYVKQFNNSASSYRTVTLLDSSGNSAFPGSITATTPATSDNSTKVATTAFVKAQGYLTSHQTLPSLSLTTSGSGNAITALSVSNHAITATKGSTFLTSHQDISGKVNKSGDTMTGQLIINRDNGSAGGGLKLTGDAQNFAISICDTGITKGTAPSGQRYCGIEYYGNDNSHYNKRLGILEFGLSAANLCTANLRAYNCTSDTNTGTCTISCNVDSSGNAYTAAPTPATADNSTKIATTAFVKAQGYITSSGSITGSAAKLGTSTVGTSVQPIYLNQGTATAVNSALKSCSAVVESEAVTNNIFKIASGSMGSAYNGLNLVILIQNIMGVNAAIWRISLNVGSTAGVYSAGTSVLVDNIGLDPANFIVAYKSNSGGNLDFELYTKIAARYSGYRFTVIQECWRASQKLGNILTLYNQLTSTGTAAITSGYTALTTSKASVNMDISGNAATVSGTAGTSLLAWNTENTVYTVGGHAIKVKLPANPNTNTTYTFATGDSNGQIKVTPSGGSAQNVSVKGLGSAAYTASTDYATSGHTHSYLPLSGGTLTGNLTITNSNTLRLKHTGITRGTAPSANVYQFFVEFKDNADKTIGGLYYTYDTNKVTKTYLMCYQGTTNQNTWNSIGVGYDASGNVFTWAPTPATADNSTKIATTAFVKAQGYITSSGSITGNAATATKLGTSTVGATNNPIYLNAGVPTATGGTLGKTIQVGVGASSYSDMLQTVQSDNNNYRSCTIRCENGNGYNTITLGAHNESNGAPSGIYVKNTNGTVTAGGPHPAADANDERLATTKWVKDKGYLTSHQSLSNYCTLNSNQTISATKTISQVNTTVIRTTSNSSELALYGSTGSTVYGASVKIHGISANVTDPAGNSRAGAIEFMSGNASTYANALATSVTWWFDAALNPDGTHSVGHPSYRWSTVYLTSNPNVSSDRRIKSYISKIGDDVLDAWDNVEWKQFKMNESIEEKGKDNARFHTGLIAQEIKEIFETNNLDPSIYGLYCYDTHEERKECKDENGHIICTYRPAGDAYSLRYTEALCMEAAYQRRKNKILENRISELENQLASVMELLKSSVIKGD